MTLSRRHELRTRGWTACESGRASLYCTIPRRAEDAALLWATVEAGVGFLSAFLIRVPAGTAAAVNIESATACIAILDELRQ
jgi:hypothetical protein